MSYNCYCVSMSWYVCILVCMHICMCILVSVCAALPEVLLWILMLTVVFSAPFYWSFSVPLCDGFCVGLLWLYVCVCVCLCACNFLIFFASVKIYWELATVLAVCPATLCSTRWGQRKVKLKLKLKKEEEMAAIPLCVRACVCVSECNWSLHAGNAFGCSPIQAQLVTLMRQLCKWQSSCERPKKPKRRKQLARERETNAAWENARRAGRDAARESAHNAAYT